MATRRRRRRVHAKRAARRVTHRRRRRVALATNPRRRVRRRRRVTLRSNPGTHRRRRSVRRRYRRNPGILSSGRGIVSQIKQGVVDGAVVVAGQVATRKAAAALNGMLPATVLATQPAVRGIATRLVAAVATSIAARKFAPSLARIAAAGAFSEVVNFALAQNATVQSFLSAYPSRRVIAGPGLRAYPRAAIAAPAGRGVGTVRGVGTMHGVGY